MLLTLLEIASIGGVCVLRFIFEEETNGIELSCPDRETGSSSSVIRGLYFLPVFSSYILSRSDKFCCCCCAFLAFSSSSSSSSSSNNLRSSSLKTSSFGFSMLGRGLVVGIKSGSDGGGGGPAITGRGGSFFSSFCICFFFCSCASLY